MQLSRRSVWAAARARRSSLPEPSSSVGRRRPPRRRRRRTRRSRRAARRSAERRSASRPAATAWRPSPARPARSSPGAAGRPARSGSSSPTPTGAATTGRARDEHEPHPLGVDLGGRGLPAGELDALIGRAQTSDGPGFLGAVRTYQAARVAAAHLHPPAAPRRSPSAPRRPSGERRSAQRRRVHVPPKGAARGRQASSPVAVARRSSMRGTDRTPLAARRAPTSRRP